MEQWEGAMLAMLINQVMGWSSQIDQWGEVRLLCILKDCSLRWYMCQS